MFVLFKSIKSLKIRGFITYCAEELVVLCGIKGVLSGRNGCMDKPIFPHGQANLSVK